MREYMEEKRRIKGERRMEVLMMCLYVYVRAHMHVHTTCSGSGTGYSQVRTVVGFEHEEKKEDARTQTWPNFLLLFNVNVRAARGTKYSNKL